MPFIILAALAMLLVGLYVPPHEGAPSLKSEGQNAIQVMPSSTPAVGQPVIEQTSTKQTSESTSSEPSNTISETDQARIDELKATEEQLKEYGKQIKDSFDNLKKTLSEQTITPPPALKPLPTVKAPEPIKIKPIDGTIKSTGTDGSECASSASKFLPQCYPNH